MIIHSKILKQFIDEVNNLEEITQQQIIEVDNYFQYKNNHIVTGKVLKQERIENTENLSITTVDVGREKLSIVCGAPNVAAGQYVIVAKVGAVLPGGLEIKPVVLRGYESNGMICSLDELGVEVDQLVGIEINGIYNFPKPVDLGIAALPLIGMERALLELDITPNRSDLLSHVGFAYDYGAMTNQKVKLPTIKVKEEKEANPLKVIINTNKAYQYHGRVIKVEVGPSPLWLQNYLIDLGLRPINNVVDITNYVLFEYGTPLHAFDRSKVKTDEIVVRLAKPNEAVVALDEEEYSLTPDDIVITNGNIPIAIGGVMGLLNTSTDFDTKEIILEAAHFDPNSIRDTAKRLNLNSDSSYRFERGVDYNRVIEGLNRATELLITYANAYVYEGIASDKTLDYRQTNILITEEEVNNVLGTNLSLNEIDDLLNRYTFITKKDKKGLLVTIPSNRQDLTEPIDLIEEIVRVFGLNNIENKSFNINQQGKLTSAQHKLRVIRNHLSSIGFNEIVSYSLLSEEDNNFRDNGNGLKILTPLNKHHEVLRSELYTGLVETLVYNNQRNYQEDYALFEIGKVFFGSNERLQLGMLLTGNLITNKWQGKELSSDFYLLKGIIEDLANILGLEFTFTKEVKKGLHPGITAGIYLEGELIGHIGKIHPSIENDFKLAPTYVLEINLTPILNTNINEIEYNPISKYPSVSRDIAIVVKRDISINEITKLIKQTTRKNLVSCELFDVYTGKGIGDDEYSLAFSLVFNDCNKTMETKEIDKLIRSVTNRLKFEFNATVRE